MLMTLNKAVELECVTPSDPAGSITWLPCLMMSHLVFC